MDKDKINQKQFRVMPVELKGIDKDNATLEAVFSTAKEDRHGDVVIQDGWDLKNFKKNPVILNSHNYGDAAEVIGKASNVKVVDGKLQGRITFAVNENPKAKVIFDLYAGGFLNAFSVGFMIKKFATDDKGITDYFTISEAELLEVSAVSVPANAQALAKQKGIDVDALDTELETEDEPETSTEDETTMEVEEETEDEKETLPSDDILGGEDEDEQDIDDDVEDVFEDKGCKPKKTYAKMVNEAVKNINEQERQALKRASDIIASLLKGEVDGRKLDERVKQQIKRRKVNKAIRELLKTK